MYTSETRFVIHNKEWSKKSSVTRVEFYSGIAGLQMFDSTRMLEHIRDIRHMSIELNSVLNESVHYSLIMYRCHKPVL